MPAGRFRDVVSGKVISPKLIKGRVSLSSLASAGCQCVSVGTSGDEGLSMSRGAVSGRELLFRALEMNRTKVGDDVVPVVVGICLGPSRGASCITLVDLGSSRSFSTAGNSGRVSAKAVACVLSILMECRGRRPTPNSAVACRSHHIGRLLAGLLPSLWPLVDRDLERERERERERASSVLFQSSYGSGSRSKLSYARMYHDRERERERAGEMGDAEVSMSMSRSMSRSSSAAALGPRVTVRTIHSVFASYI
ncbi:hypothetical protein KIPB_013658, partial [Kipferlia bialata]|eukprot:g13658.t1